MDELNLADRFAKKDDERPVPSRGKLKRLRRGKTGVGMEKPQDIDLPEDREMPGDEDMPEEDVEAPRSEMKNLIGEAEDMADIDEDEAFTDLVDRMEGGSASAGRARAKRRAMKKPGNDGLRAEFADRR